ncbi:DoxX family protein [Cohnella thailandensis]|uniref:DoxX family protein n=1 Tax=Cohnella thailandensis TaxID=557557 RepID=A0A841T1E2_9BACL|nr:DoxX family protein [Cohnella thailandensis]MBB6634891.1 DoxX family protein [Cohnella thailandensis]MBP1975887.1 putative membrane protein YphA (DoxX/SURF4 family) [Cohnella thailandensis]
MNIALWIAQGLLALGFVYSGWMKVQVEKAKASWPWAREIPKGLVVAIGLAELLGAVGVIAPLASGIAPALTPIAAFALAAVVLLGALFHVSRREYKDIGINIVFLALALIVAFGRI